MAAFVPMRAGVEPFGEHHAYNQPVLLFGDPHRTRLLEAHVDAQRPTRKNRRDNFSGGIAMTYPIGLVGNSTEGAALLRAWH